MVSSIFPNSISNLNICKQPGKPEQDAVPSCPKTACRPFLHADGLYTIWARRNLRSFQLGAQFLFWILSLRRSRAAATEAIPITAFALRSHSRSPALPGTAIIVSVLVIPLAWQQPEKLFWHDFNSTGQFQCKHCFNKARNFCSGFCRCEEAAQRRLKQSPSRPGHFAATVAHLHSLALHKGGKYESLSFGVAAIREAILA